MKCFGAIFFLMCPMVIFTQSVKERDVKYLVKEYEYFCNTVPDASLSPKEKDDFIERSISNLFCGEAARTYNDIEKVALSGSKTLKISDYINFLEDRNMYKCSVDLLSFQFLEGSRDIIDLIAFVEKKDNSDNRNNTKLVLSLQITNDSDFPLRICAVKEYVDEDSDGVYDGVDRCLFSKNGMVNSQGCTDLDSDGFFGDASKSDPFYDLDDNQPCVPNKSNENCDFDGDGVPNNVDKCPNSEGGEFVDSNGCTDRDKDGYFSDIDQSSTNFDRDDFNRNVPVDTRPKIKSIEKEKIKPPVSKNRRKKPFIQLAALSDIVNSIVGDPVGEFFAEGQLGFNFPLRPLQQKSVFNYDTNKWADSFGYALSGLTGELSMNHYTYSRLGVGVGLGFFTFSFDENELSEDISTLIDVKTDRKANVYIDTTHLVYSYAVIKPLFRFSAIEDNELSVVFSPGIGVLTSNGKANSIEGNIDGDNSLLTGRFSNRIDLGASNRKRSLLFKGDLTITFEDSGGDFIIGGALSMISSSYKISPDVGFDDDLRIPDLNISNMKIRALQVNVSIQYFLY